MVSTTKKPYRFSRIAKIATVILSASLLNACNTSPTGRSQLAFYSDEKLQAAGEQNFVELKQTETIVNDPKTLKYIACVTDRIIANVPKNVHQGQWEVAVFDSEEVNAFALPGGKIGIYTGILAVAENADQLAAIIGHEVGHVIAKHGNERVSSDTAANVGLSVASYVLSQNSQYSAKTNDLLLSALGMGVNVGLLLPYSRTHETEADNVGQELMAKAGFDPEGSVQLWRNMSKLNQGKEPPELLSTHPANNNRIRELTHLLKTNKKHYAKALIRGDVPVCNKIKV